MKIRIYFPDVPYPPTGGSAFVVWEQVKSLLEIGHEVEVVCWKSPTRELAPLPRDEIFNKLTITFLELSVTPETKAQRLLRVAHSLLTGAASPEEYYYSTQALRTYERTRPAKADLGIYIYGFSYQWLKHASTRDFDSRRVVYFHNLESDLFAMRANESSFPQDWIHRLNAGRLYNHEVKLCKLVDEIWQISTPDLNDFKIRIAGKIRAPLRLVPPSFAQSLFSSRTKNFLNSQIEDNFSLGFVGALHYTPNNLSALWIVESLCPELEKRGFTGEIIIAGGGASRELKEAAKKFSFVKMPGFLHDMDSFLSRLSFMLVPHIKGSGVRIKLLEALASGIPALTTRGGAERIDESFQDHPGLFISDDAKVWADYICSQQAYRKRVAISEAPFPTALDGHHIFNFLD